MVRKTGLKPLAPRRKLADNRQQTAISIFLQGFENGTD